MRVLCSILLLLISLPVAATQFMPHFWVAGVVVEHRPARFDDFLQNNNRDVTVIRVEAPAKDSGRRLIVIHDEVPSPDSLYRRKGVRLRLWVRGAFWGEDGYISQQCVERLEEEPSR